MKQITQNDLIYISSGLKLQGMKEGIYKVIDKDDISYTLRMPNKSKKIRHRNYRFDECLINDIRDIMKRFARMSNFDICQIVTKKMVKKYIGLGIREFSGDVFELGIFETLQDFHDYRSKNKIWNSEVFPFYQ